MSNMVRASHYVYFMRDKKDGTIKIGFSIDPTYRKDEIRDHYKVKVEILGMFPGGRDVEKRVHTLFDEHRLTGEWFMPHQSIMDFIADECVSVEDFKEMDRASRASDLAAFNEECGKEYDAMSEEDLMAYLDMEDAYIPKPNGANPE